MKKYSFLNIIKERVVCHYDNDIFYSYPKLYIWQITSLSQILSGHHYRSLLIYIKFRLNLIKSGDLPFSIGEGITRR